MAVLAGSLRSGCAFPSLAGAVRRDCRALLVSGVGMCEIFPGVWREGCSQTSGSVTASFHISVPFKLSFCCLSFALQLIFIYLFLFHLSFGFVLHFPAVPFPLPLHFSISQIRLQLWDTAGQERFLIPSSIRDSAVALIVFGITSRYRAQGLQGPCF